MAKTTSNPVKSRRPKGITPRQQTAIVAILKGSDDVQAAKAAGVCRQTVSEWRNQPQFAQSLNIEQNKLLRATMDNFREKMAAMTEAAFAGVSAALKRGDSGVARWWLDSIGIDEHARRIFEQTVNPEIYPEGLDAVIDEMATRRVDAFLTARGIGALERLRIREAMTAKEAAALRDEQGDNGPEE